MAAARPKTKSIEELDSEAQGALPARKDPAPRPTQGGVMFGHIENRDPGRVYVFVNKFDQMSLAQYQSSGYRIERWRSGGVQPMGWIPDNHEEGELIEQLDMYLMSVDQERYEEIHRFGHDGQSGQKAVDEEEAKLIKRRGAFDPMRGIHGFMPGRHFHLEDDKADGHGHGDLSPDK